MWSLTGSSAVTFTYVYLSTLSKGLNCDLEIICRQAVVVQWRLTAVSPWVCGSVGLWAHGSVGSWVRGSVGPCVCGTLDLWVRGSVVMWARGSVGMWARGSAGLWVRGSVSMWVCVSVGAGVCGSVSLGHLCQSVHKHSSSEIRTGYFQYNLVSFSSFFRLQTISFAACHLSQFKWGCNLCMGPIRNMGSRDFTWDCRLYMEPTGYIWHL
jgi:hypothetical protein